MDDGLSTVEVAEEGVTAKETQRTRDRRPNSPEKIKIGKYQGGGRGLENGKKNMVSEGRGPEKNRLEANTNRNLGHRKWDPDENGDAP